MKKYLLFIACSFVVSALFAQTDSLGLYEDTELVEPIDQSDIEGVNEVIDSTSVLVKAERTAERRALHSAILPGWGQIENKQNGKAALFFTAVAGGIYSTVKQGNTFRDFDDAYSSRLQNFTAPIDPYATSLDLDGLFDERRKSRSGKDIATSATVYAYLINVADAVATYEIKNSKVEHPPAKAAYYSLLLPGMGQAYNKKYWKIPIVYGALGTAGYFAITNRNEVRRYTREIEYRSVGETTNFRPNLDDAGLKDNLDYWRKWRDFSYVSAGVIYALNVIDATVDAHLWDYDVSDDLSFKPAPAIQQHADGNMYYGITITFDLPYKMDNK